LKANLPSSTRALFSDKARSFSQSERAFYGNFIIKELEETPAKVRDVAFALGNTGQRYVIVM